MSMNRIHLRWTVSLLCVALGLSLWACSPASPPELVAVPGTTPPTLDGKVDAVWSDAPLTQVPIQGGTIGEITVQMQALYTDSHIYLLCRWPDSTESVGKQQWLGDGISWQQDKDADEDRLCLLFPMGSTRARFAREGCKRYCHDDFMATKQTDERADMWHWKSVRSNPVGQLDDKHLVYATAAANDGGRRGDAREKVMREIGDQTVEVSHYVSNVNAAAAQPAFMHAPEKSIADTRHLLAEDAVPFDPDANLETVPGYLVGAHIGSRGDVQTIGVHSNGEWILEVKRALDTGHDDDVLFEPVRDYPFGLAVMDNVGGDKHSWAKQPITLKFSTGASSTE